jgi:lipopolysaccharide/colanic/teichoic acid biosynthesis glycosyltransferase
MEFPVRITAFSLSTLAPTMSMFLKPTPAGRSAFPYLVWRSTLDRVAAALALLVASPVLLAAMLCIYIESGAPVLFCQTRVGQHGTPFRIFKLRSMRSGALGKAITGSGDPRITRTGSFLRHYKIDELPQLWNVLLGHMELVGPRPEVPFYVDQADPAWRTVLTCKPGLTDLSTLLYRNEEEILAQCVDPDRTYRQELLPKKLLLSTRYQERRTLAMDIKLLLLTARFSFRPSSFDPELVTRIFLKEIA